MKNQKMSKQEIIYKTDSVQLNYFTRYVLELKGLLRFHYIKNYIYIIQEQCVDLT